MKDVPLVKINASALADQVGETTSNTLDSGEGVSDLVLTINVGVEDTKDVLEIVIFEDKSLRNIQKKDIDTIIARK